MSSLFKDHPLFQILSHTARQLGCDAYVVGGYVRDLLLERPSKDIDVVCVGSGTELAKSFAEKVGITSKVYFFKRFGTAMVKYQNWQVEFVGARKESYNKYSRKPKVEDGTLEDDQNRRDFTINTLAISLNQSSYGVLLDTFDGIGDLKRKILRTPLAPDTTFSDDPLRMMRCIRFATQLNFDIAADTFAAIAKNKARIAIVSQERITQELNKIILSPLPSYGFKLLLQTGLLALIFPHMLKLKGVEAIQGKSHKDNFYHTLQVLDNIAKVTDNLWLRWAAILHDIAKPATKRFDKKAGWTFHGHEEKGARMIPQLFRNLKLPVNEPMKYVQKLVRLHLRPIALAKEEITDAAIRRLLFEAGDDTDDLMKLCRADITSKNDGKIKKYLANFDRVEARMAVVEQKDKLRNFQPIITGETIMKAFNLPPSKIVGQIKAAIREAILEGTIANQYEQAHDYMLKQGSKIIDQSSTTKS